MAPVVANVNVAVNCPSIKVVLPADRSVTPANELYVMDGTDAKEIRWPQNALYESVVTPFAVDPV